jgi:hypothetical protein
MLFLWQDYSEFRLKEAPIRRHIREKDAYLKSLQDVHDKKKINCVNSRRLDYSILYFRFHSKKTQKQKMALRLEATMRLEG